VALSNITITAAGNPAGNIYPRMDVLIDGNVVKTYEVRGNASASQFQTFSFTYPHRIHISQLTLSYNNDGDSVPAGQDRDLRVDKVRLDGVDYQVEASDTYSVGSWSSSNGCGGGYKQSEWLHCNGSFSFK